MTNSKTVDISLEYHGPDVDDGTMLIEDVVPALQGFSNAYSKIVATKNLPYQHKIKITGLSKNSFDIALKVWETLGNNADQLQAVAIMTGGAIAVVKIIFGIIDLIKHTKNKPSKNKPGGNNIVVVINSEGVEKEFPLEVFNGFIDKTISCDLEKLVYPLEDGKINSLDFTARLDSKTITTSITGQEKEYFIGNTEEIAKTEQATLQGEFLSIHLHTNKGRFILSSGRQVTYQLPENNPDRFYPFVIQKGRLMKIKCVVHLDSNLDTTKVDILDVEPMQQSILESN